MRIEFGPRSPDPDLVAYRDGIGTDPNSFERVQGVAFYAPYFFLAVCADDRHREHDVRVPPPGTSDPSFYLGPTRYVVERRLRVMSARRGCHEPEGTEKEYCYANHILHLTAPIIVVVGAGLTSKPSSGAVRLSGERYLIVM